MSSNHEEGSSPASDQTYWSPIPANPVHAPPYPGQQPQPSPAFQPQPTHRSQPFSQPPYASQPYPSAPVWLPPVPVYPYTHWGRRVGAYLIDFAPIYVAMIPFWVGYVLFYVRVIELSTTTTPDASLFGDLLRPALIWVMIGFVLMLAAIGWQWYNRWLTGGRTGQSMGKRVLRTKLVAEVNGQPIGAANAFLRDLLHILDGAVYIGYLWPLWDAKRQTFSDMIMKTVVIDHPAPSGPAPATPAATGTHPNGPTP